MARLSREDLAQAETRCTPLQFEALKLWNIGIGYKRISLVLHIHPSTAKARVEAALRNIDMSIHHFAA